eukprot:TRINITY_DN16452_c0_g1_i3.p1 TRINITY_DN16452_c0_g1~~TRINITY_DN16452_c0_g1_i3.p1  ORF type:complete len:190 (-),score=56.61 TRINITY_DN16452_c0_g1_i3:326-895(-)
MCIRDSINAEYGKHNWSEMAKRTTEDIDRGMRSIFDELDTGGDGMVTGDEIRAYLAKRTGCEVTEELIAPHIDHLLRNWGDADKDGKLDFAEFKTQLNLHIAPYREEAENLELFVRMAEHEDGKEASYITPASLHKILTTYREEEEPELTEEDCREMIREAALRTSHGGVDRLTLEEFVRLKDMVTLFR